MKTILYLAWVCAMAAGWITSILNDAGAREWGWLIVNIILPPIGMFRGWLMWLGVV